LKRVYVSVINDLVTDQRVHKACLSLIKSGFEPVLVGRKLASSPPMDERPYRTIRMRLLFEKGPFFYAEYNFRLFFLLLFHQYNWLLANDLDTLLANYVVSRLKHKDLLFDSHEYYTETPELVNRPLIQRFWKQIEKFIVPRLPEMITVNESIAEMFRNEYHIPVHIVRNVPLRMRQEQKPSRTELGLPKDKKLLVMQGSGINVQRGAEELVHAMKFLPDCLLLIIGGGDVIPALKQMTNDLAIEDRVSFLGRMPFIQMMQYTRQADLGFTLDKDTNINYRYSLPNKLFDFIQAGVPVISSQLVEINKVIDQYQIGTYVSSHEPVEIAAVIRKYLDNEPQLELWRKNLIFAAQELCWENEEQLLLKVYVKYDR